MDHPKPTIERLELAGFKSIRHASIDLGPINVLIGGNGSGKSNLLSYFGLLGAALRDQQENYLQRHGGTNAFLHLGAKHTPEILADLTIRTPAARFLFHQRFGFQAPDGLDYTFRSQLLAEDPPPTRSEVAENPVTTGEFAAIKSVDPSETLNLPDRIDIYHFHDTSLASPLRSSAQVDDAKALHGDGGNLPAVLYHIKQTDLDAYRRIVATVRQIAPFFDDFSLAPRSLDPTRILLDWRQLHSEVELGPHQLSDGTLRAIALVTVLLQPEPGLPDLLIFDEPEIGLHPYALTVIAALFKRAARHTQVIIATQSPTLLDRFNPEDLIVVDRKGNESSFSRPDPAKLAAWRDDYTLGEAWQHNLLGGDPHS
jgi:predicted ATPase